VKTPVTVYCYYRVAPAQASAARQAIVQVFRSVEAHHGVVARLFKGQRDHTLWMEVYEQVDDVERFEKTLAELCASHRFSELLAPGSERRVERFVAIDA
jgi:uncharacterized protein DUF4936